MRNPHFTRWSILGYPKVQDIITLQAVYILKHPLSSRYHNQHGQPTKKYKLKGNITLKSKLSFIFHITSIQYMLKLTVLHQIGQRSCIIWSILMRPMHKCCIKDSMG